MTAAEKLERLTRWIPGLAGYQDKETSRDTDAKLRARMAEILDKRKLELEESKRLRVEARRLDLLPELDAVSGKLDRLANTVRFAARGERGVFALDKVNRETLERLYEYDLFIAEKLPVLAERTASVRNTFGEDLSFRSAIAELSRAVDQLAECFGSRDRILSGD